jgi:hypothetical protein
MPEPAVVAVPEGNEQNTPQAVGVGHQAAARSNNIDGIQVCVREEIKPPKSAGKLYFRCAALARDKIVTTNQAETPKILCCVHILGESRSPTPVSFF